MQSIGHKKKWDEITFNFFFLHLSVILLFYGRSKNIGFTFWTPLTIIPALYPESDVPTFLSHDFWGRIHLSSAALGKSVFRAPDLTEPENCIWLNFPIPWPTLSPHLHYSFRQGHYAADGSRLMSLGQEEGGTEPQFCGIFSGVTLKSMKEVGATLEYIIWMNRL